MTAATRTCTNVLIEGMDFNVGDDGIAIKSGRDQDGWRIGQATEIVTIRATVISHVGPSLSEAKCRAECGISILRTAR